MLAQCSFGGMDGQLGQTLAKHLRERDAFEMIVVARTRSVRVEHIHLLRRPSGTVNRAAKRAHAWFDIKNRLARVITPTPGRLDRGARDKRVCAGATFPRMRFRLNKERGGALADHVAVAIDVEGARRRLRTVVPVGRK